MLDIAMFLIAGIEFGIAFVVKSKAEFKKLQAQGAKYGMNIDMIADADDGDILCTIVDTDETASQSEANSFLKSIKSSKTDWVQDHETVDGRKLIVFYAKETLS